MERSPFRIGTNGRNNARHLLDQDCNLLVLQNSGKWTLQAVLGSMKVRFHNFPQHTSPLLLQKTLSSKHLPGLSVDHGDFPINCASDQSCCGSAAACTQFCGFSKFVEDFLANFWRKNFTMARLSTKISFARQLYSGKTPWNLYIYIYIRYMYQSCLPSHYFYKTTKKTERNQEFKCHLFFNQKKKHMGEILKNNGEWVNCGWKPTNLFWNREKFPGIVCRPACCPSDPFMDWSSSSGIESSDSILLSVIL